MGLVGFLKFAFKCFNLLAWPLFGLGCPLYASIRAIENNSNLEMRNLVTYWILFSLVSLFELAFVKLIDWLPIWPYMKLMAMCFLVLPDFNGASYVYECLLRSCLSVDLRPAIKYYIKPKEEKIFLALAERYVQENGSEALERALEKLLDRESKHMKPDVGLEEIKAMTNTEEKGTATEIQSKYEEPNVGKVDAIPVAAMKLSNVEESRLGKENATMGQLKDESPAVATGQSKHTKLDIGVEVMKAMTYTEEKETVAAIQSKYEETNADKVDATTVELPERSLVAATKLSQVKDPHVNKENGNALKDESPPVATEQVKCVEPNLAKNEKNTVATGEIKEKTAAIAGGESKAVEITDSEKVQREWTCAVCQVTTTSEKIFDSHLQGRRHKAQELKASKQVNENEASSSSVASLEPEETPSVDRPNENRNKKQEYKFECTICNVKMHNEVILASHLGGKKHLSKTQQHIIDTLGGGGYY